MARARKATVWVIEVYASCNGKWVPMELGAFKDEFDAQQAMPNSVEYRVTEYMPAPGPRPRIRKAK